MNSEMPPLEVNRPVLLPTTAPAIVAADAPTADDPTAPIVAVVVGSVAMLS